jgi:hypothetical protein
LNLKSKITTRIGNEILLMKFVLENEPRNAISSIIGDTNNTISTNKLNVKFCENNPISFDFTTVSNFINLGINKNVIKKVPAKTSRYFSLYLFKIYKINIIYN